ncbi:pectate lyase [Geminisphaera colitermitum]|uniref:pectate lyase n=1 Tax=Geminisphaera colitermitum TaxID=1148786 RepID=UPI0001964E6E|nr:pectate lyase [Geminisphaera colitermitum]
MKISPIVLFIAAAMPVMAEPVSVPENFWRVPAQTGRFVTLAASWDAVRDFTSEERSRNSNGINDLLNNARFGADFASGNSLAGGYGIAPLKDGVNRQGIIVTEPGGHLHFTGGSNLNPDAATVRFAAKGQFWERGQLMTLFSARRETFSIEIVKKADALALIVRKFQTPNSREKKLGTYWSTISEVALPLPENLDTQAWHSVVASWDAKAGTGLIALDGAGERGALTFPNNKRGTLVIFLGSAAKVGAHAYAMDVNSLQGTAFDELQICNQPLDLLLAFEKLPPPPPLLVKAEQGARTYFATLEKIQRFGGWQNMYSWPTLLGSDAQGRELISYDNVISNDKSRGTALIAAHLLYGYEIFNDHHYLDLARKTADFYVAAQIPEGAWLYIYNVGVNRVESREKAEYKFQDSVQSHPLYLLCYIYRLTGEKKYLEAAMRAGEFYLSAQNPDGSWSHHYDIKAKCGRTARGLPNGGEINDLAMNDAIDVMTLMWHFTKDRRYIDAMKRAGDWLLKAQLGGAVNGCWAQQYDSQMRPVWAREFEPPAMSRTATADACDALAALYRISGDKRYRDAIVLCRDWFAKNTRGGKMFDYYEVETGRPIIAHQNKVYHLDDEVEAKAYAAFFRGVPARSDWQVPDIDGILKTAVYPVVEKPLDETGATVMLQLTQSRGKMAADTQNEAGMWIFPKVAGSIQSMGAGFVPGHARALMLLQYIDAARTARGELPLVYRGGSYPHGLGEFKNLARPSGWYDVPWNQNP